MTVNHDRLALLNALLRRDLSSFIARAFATVDPGSPFLHNWHIDAIACQLDRVARGEITRLIITMPPRSLKSIAASVAFPAWLLGQNPRMRILAVSYAEGLSEKLALDCMKVLEAPWYRACFPTVQVAKGRGARSDFETTKGGGRFSTSVNGSLTGRGGDIILIDDPHKPEDAGSEVKRVAVLDWYRSTLLSRLNDPQTSPIVLIQQRVHEEDLAGVLLEQGGWFHLDLPAIAEYSAKIDLGLRGSQLRREGDLLHPDRLPRDLLDRRRDELGSYVFAAQYQQSPAPLGGGIVKWDWFRTYDRAPDRQGGDRIVQSWDTATTAEEASDYSVCTTWQVRGQSAWLLNIYRAKLEFPELRRQVEGEARRWKANLILIERAGSGIQLIQDLQRRTGFNVKGIVPKLDKATRLLAVTPVIEGGRVAIPKEGSWLAEFRREISLFPKGRNDDQVDSLSQFLGWFTQPEPTVLVGRY
ncbi:phage terminase large subunit [Pseudohalocynthiibacter aestuariivivens]|uniref:Phage terminase large subunit n=1 Tax=Pseudohalocynthiibacter aestuariivivens TaxID=1591409 RepID=A0ABV5JGZ7_9RHOB|nr:phage terminase large subunit [Pseudohalocynthiibacter aestuariivivens]MBS9718527.1 phage terminase large subunit [Pseudohalocynthiibacter aestuariivivens]